MRPETYGIPEYVPKYAYQPIQLIVKYSCLLESASL